MNTGPKLAKKAPMQGIDLHMYVAMGGNPKNYKSTSGSREGTFTNNK